MSGSFESALAAAEAAATDQPEHPHPPLKPALDAFREALRLTQNLGQTGDQADLYYVVDQVATRVREAYPGAMCTKGCDSCCNSATAVFDVTATEWELIRAHVKHHWTSAQRERFRARFEREHRPRLTTYRLLQAIWHFEPVADHIWQHQGYRCPFLEAGACSIYAARPLACRMYGFFGLLSRLQRAPSIYGCRLQADHFEKVQAQQVLQLPAARTVWNRAARLTRRPLWQFFSWSRILPLWVARDE